MASSSLDIPEFFHVFLPEFCDSQLKISTAFSSIHLQQGLIGSSIAAKLKRSSTNKEWRINLVKEDGEFFFKQGWKNFVEDNAISIGEFMVFQYHGKSKFTVDIFGTNGCVRSKESSSYVHGKFLCKMNNVVEEEIKEETMVFPQKEKKKKAGRPPSLVRKGVPAVDQATQLAKTLMSKSDNASFFVRMTNTYVSIGFVHLPQEFVANYMKMGKIIPEAVELHVGERSWRTKVRNYQRSNNKETYYKFGAGFRDFLRDNNIKEGQICVFEALNIPCLDFNVFVIKPT